MDEAGDAGFLGGGQDVARAFRVDHLVRAGHLLDGDGHGVHHGGHPLHRRPKGGHVGHVPLQEVHVPRVAEAIFGSGQVVDQAADFVARRDKLAHYVVPHVAGCARHQNHVVTPVTLR